MRVTEVPGRGKKKDCNNPLYRILWLGLIHDTQ